MESSICDKTNFIGGNVLEILFKIFDYFLKQKELGQILDKIRADFGNFDIQYSLG